MAGLPNIIIISLDSCRPDHLGCYGHFRDTSPHLDRLAGEGVRFDRFFSVCGWTLPSHVSLMTGLDPMTHGLQEFQKANRRLPAGAPHLVRELKAAGYITAGMAGDNVVFGFAPAVREGLDHMEMDVGNKDGQTMRPLVEKGLAWIEKVRRENRKQPFFLYVHTNDIHSRGFFPDYTTAPEFLSKWTKDPDTRLLGKTPEERAKIKAQYDGCISFVDHWIGILMQELEKMGIARNTLTVILSDHGDLLWDQGGDFWGHAFLYDPVLRSVLLMHWPEGKDARFKSGSISGLATHSDIAPTILDLIGLPFMADTDGTSLLPLLESKRREVRLAAFASQRHGGSLIALRTHKRKLVLSDYEGQPANAPVAFLRERAPRGIELYDLENDPGEKINIADDDAQSAAALRVQLDVWMAECNARAGRLGITAP